MKKSILICCLFIVLVGQASAQNNADACTAMKTVMQALTTKEYDKVIDWKQKQGMFHYASKVTIPGFKNCRFMVASGVVLFEALVDGSNISNNRQMLSDLGWIIAPCFTGYASTISGSKHTWFKDGNPQAGRVSVYDRGNGNYLELEMSGVSRGL